MPRIAHALQFYLLAGRAYDVAHRRWRSEGAFHVVKCQLQLLHTQVGLCSFVTKQRLGVLHTSRERNNNVLRLAGRLVG